MSTRCTPGDLIAGLLLLMCLYSSRHGAELESLSEKQTIQLLDIQQRYSNVIVVPADIDPQPGQVRHIMLKPGVEQVIIEPAEINFRKEADSFASHRRHYLVYWSLFMSMLVLDAAWAE